MSKIKAIVEGHTNFVKSKTTGANEEVEELASQRLAICDSCSKKTKTNRCSECGCYLPAKTRSLNSNCPLNKW